MRGEDVRVAVDAVVREWHSEEGWGVIHAPETPGGCWAHFSHIVIPGYRALSPGQAVTLEWEVVGQDGYSFRAVRVWPVGNDLAEGSAERHSTAHTSTLALHFDDKLDR